jgi:hypothetical protein
MSRGLIVISLLDCPCLTSGGSPGCTQHATQRSYWGSPPRPRRRGTRGAAATVFELKQRCSQPTAAAGPPRCRCRPLRPGQCSKSLAAAVAGSSAHLYAELLTLELYAGIAKTQWASTTWKMGRALHAPRATTARKNGRFAIQRKARRTQTIEGCCWHVVQPATEWGNWGTITAGSIGYC